MNVSVTNNFDLIRLFAASQVAILHGAKHLGYDNDFLQIFSLFPGVPIFFFVSGFLIYGSYDKSSANPKPIQNFFTKRILRLYPALLLCLIVSILSVWHSGYFQTTDIKSLNFVSWFLAQSTFFQFYNPDFLRGYGVGVLNGSLWTISVEIQFYMLTPLIFLAFKYWSRYIIYGLVLIFVFANILNTHLNETETMIEKLFTVSFIPWLYMFVLGALCYKHQQIIAYVMKVPFFITLSLFAIIYYYTRNLGWDNGINPIAYIALLALVIKCAFTFPNLSDTILKRNDFSYGIYIAHMPIINYLLYIGIEGALGFIYAMILTIGFAILSWYVIEKPSLKLKRNSLRGY